MPDLGWAAWCWLMAIAGWLAMPGPWDRVCQWGETAGWWFARRALWEADRLTWWEDTGAELDELEAIIEAQMADAQARVDREAWKRLTEADRQREARAAIAALNADLERLA